ncbi:2-amino-4-hydroxy-6-hydroxymethyldihydropteridine diphosphokinase [Herbaspirillum sp. alder98]|uniref:2-amino-4-hydroxy-6- hydroxymethyldihydropteridine diphosphokinase n=1 Tax=Herbaspirillum sp. alder98 TaxID=2913096 RepID=UPI001CD89A19|nr:2-amino-4-hydroxy-6-hydroxymethyldihydropteridine diphosphokinase [Herbaspirillum sp. alder98]MCA1325301.1 2-amino-4-hydroxy-6-hydroxymethyldihydropteridine diphosphokinase [Herbaspirillum sp. alder98]
MSVTAYIGIGANLGDARASVEQAIAQLASVAGCRLLDQSSLYRTAPVDAGGDDYVNAVAAVATDLTPQALLHALQEIERQHGRQRSYRNAPRTLDMDLLLHGEQRLDSAELTLPHPRMTQRAFVLVPLLEIAPAIVIPGHGAAQSCLSGVADQAIARL